MKKILIGFIVSLILISSIVSALTKVDEQTVIAWSNEDRNLKLILEDLDYDTQMVSFIGKLTCTKISEACQEIGEKESYTFRWIPIKGCVYASGPDYKRGYGKCEIELIDITYDDKSYIKIKSLNTNEEIILSLPIDIEKLYETLWERNIHEILNRFNKLDTYFTYVGKNVICVKEMVNIYTSEITIKKIETIEEFKKEIPFSDLINEEKLQNLFEECKLKKTVFVFPPKKEDFVTKCVSELKPVLEKEDIEYDENYNASEYYLPHSEKDINYDLIVECKKREVFLDTEKLKEHTEMFGDNIIENIFDYRNHIFPEEIKERRYKGEHYCSVEKAPRTNTIGRISCGNKEDVGPKIRELAANDANFRIEGCEDYNDIDALIECVINLHENQEIELEEESIEEEIIINKKDTIAEEAKKEIEEPKEEVKEETKQEVKEVKQQIGFFKRVFGWFINLFG